MINHPANNIALAAIFHRMADCYRYLGTDERFRAIAYGNIARVLQNMKEDIAVHAGSVKSLDEIGGIGESIAEKIIEYLKTGKVQSFEKLKKQVPYDLLELMDISGFGPATLKLLHEKLKVKTREDIIAAIESGKLSKLKGFAAKKIENMSRALKIVKETQRLPLKEASKIADEIVNEIRKFHGVQRAEIAGSIRRRKDTIGDIDIVVLAPVKKRRSIVNKFVSLKQVKKILAKGTTRASVNLSYQNVQVDIRIVHDYEYGAAMLYFTGSKEHNIKLRTIAKQQGMKINEYGIFNAKTNKRIAGKTEEEIYAVLKLKYIPPEKRLDKGEIEKAGLN